MEDFGIRTDAQGHLGVAGEQWLDPQATALLLIDVQKYGADRRYDITRYHPFMEGEGAEAYFRQIEQVALPAMQRLLACFRERGWPIFHLRYCSHDPDYRDMPTLWRVASRQLRDAEGRPYQLAQDADAAQIMPAVAPQAGEAVLDKTTNGGFASTKLDLYLRALRTVSLVVAGCWTNACVETTVREAADRGYLCSLAADACFGPGEDFHKASLRVLNQFYGQVLETDEIIRRLGAFAE